MTSALSSRQRIFVFSILFIAVEVLLIAFVDKPLSQYLRTVDVEQPVFVNVFRAITDLGKSAWYLWPSGLGAIACLLLARWQRIAAHDYRKFQTAGQNLAFFFASVAISGLVTDAIKRLVGRSRPVLLMRENYYSFDPLSGHFVHNSWPSGHATTMFAVVFALMILWPKGRKTLLTIAILLGLSRVIVNAHFLSDVVAGALVGILSVKVIERFFRTRGWLATSR